MDIREILPIFEPTWKNMISILFLAIFLDIILETYFVVDENESSIAPLSHRLLSISHIVIYIFIMNFFFENPLLKALLLVFMPFSVYFVILAIFVYPRKFKFKFVLSALVSHTLCFFVFYYMIKNSQWVNWEYIPVAWGIYMIYFLLLWKIIPKYKMLFIHGYKATVLLFSISAAIMGILMFLIL